MDNQHHKITGYRELSQAEIDLMNEIKEEGRRLRSLHDLVQEAIRNDIDTDPAERRRWLAIGRTYYQQALMALTRAVAAPNFE